jgi:hypothetical protein
MIPSVGGHDVGGRDGRFRWRAVSGRHRFDVHAVPAAADAVTIEVEGELALDVRRDHRVGLELLLAEAPEGGSSRLEPCFLVFATDESLVRPGRHEDLVQLGFRHDVAASVPVMEDLDGLVQGRAVDQRMMRRHRDPEDVRVLVAQRAAQVGIDLAEAEHQWLVARDVRADTGTSTAANRASRSSGVGVTAPAPGVASAIGRSSASSTNGDTRRARDPP